MYCRQYSKHGTSLPKFEVVVAMYVSVETRTVGKRSTVSATVRGFQRTLNKSYLLSASRSLSSKWWYCRLNVLVEWPNGSGPIPPGRKTLFPLAADSGGNWHWQLGRKVHTCQWRRSIETAVRIRRWRTCLKRATALYSIFPLVVNCRTKCRAIVLRCYILMGFGTFKSPNILEVCAVILQCGYIPYLIYFCAQRLPVLLFSMITVCSQTPS